MVYFQCIYINSKIIISLWRWLRLLLKLNGKQGDDIFAMSLETYMILKEMVLVFEWSQGACRPCLFLD